MPNGRSFRRRLEQPIRPAGPVRGRPRGGSRHNHIHLNIDRETWKLARTYWINNQREDDGGWGYYKPMDPTGSMTCAGIASLVIADDVLHEPDAKVSRRPDRRLLSRLLGRPGPDRPGHRLAAAELLRPRQSAFAARRRPLALLLSLRAGACRAALLAAKIGEHDWYREGAASWSRPSAPSSREVPGKGAATPRTTEDIATSLALLFLSKGRWPVLMAKVQYRSPPPPLGNRKRGHPLEPPPQRREQPHDLRRGQWKRELTWQVIDLNKATVDDLLQVPVLFFSGGGNPLPKNAEEAARTGRQPPRLHRPRRFHFCRRRGLLPSELRPGLSRTDGTRLPASPNTASSRWTPRIRSGTAEQKIPPDQARPAAGHRLRLPDERRLFPGRSAGDPRPSLACLWEFRGRAAGKLQPGRPGADPGRPGDRHQRAGLCHEPRVARRRTSSPRQSCARTRKVERGKFVVAKLEHPGGCDAAPRALANLMEQAARVGHPRRDASQVIRMTDPACSTTRWSSCTAATPFA